MKTKIISLNVALLLVALSAISIMAQTKMQSLDAAVITTGEIARTPAARAVAADGIFRVEVAVDSVGKVSSAKVVSGHTLMRDAIKEAALQTTFKQEAFGKAGYITFATVASTRPPAAKAVNATGNVIFSIDRNNATPTITLIKGHALMQIRAREEAEKVLSSLAASSATRITVMF